jgi:hypothetical protein
MKKRFTEEGKVPVPEKLVPHFKAGRKLRGAGRLSACGRNGVLTVYVHDALHYGHDSSIAPYVLCPK